MPQVEKDPLSVIPVIPIALVVWSVIELVRAFIAFGEDNVDSTLNHLGNATLMAAIGLQGFAREERLQDRIMGVMAFPLVVVFGLKAFREDWFHLFAVGLVLVLCLSWVLKRRRAKLSGQE